MTAILTVGDLRSGYGETEIVHDVSLAVEEGAVCALVGKNGAGKTTLLKTIVGLLPARAGRVSLGGKDITGMSTHRIVGRRLAYAPQEQAIFADLSVEENLRLGGVGMRKPDFTRRAEAMIELFPILGQRRKQSAGTLSGGEQGMLRIARALLQEPEVILLDEISEGISAAVLEKLAAALRREREQRSLSILLVEQNLEFALGLASRFLLMERGCIVGDLDIGDPTAEEQVAQHLAL